MNRRQAREAAMRLVYEWEMGGDAWENTITDLLEIKPGEAELDYTLGLYNAVKERCEALDERIQRFSSGWRIDRMARVDLAILRVACRELENAVVPPAVVINEAVELSRVYSSEKAGSFINGILGNMSREKAD